ncbi:hypothetical protein C8F01DRAFT_1354058 [Mycena amicta]|nr:hypothetical protein C8F01DRAFT_1354058 [Mycena amicta]
MTGAWIRSSSLRINRESEQQQREGHEDAESMASTLVDTSRGHLSGRGGIGNFHPDQQPQPELEEAQEFPWPRGRQRTRGGSHSTGRGGYGNIAASQSHTSSEWTYSSQEQEILRAHAQARRIAIPVGRGGYGNISHARSLAAAAAAETTRSHSVDPANAPVSMSFHVPLPTPRYKRPSLLNGHRKDQRYAEESDSDSDSEQ